MRYFTGRLKQNEISAVNDEALTIVKREVIDEKLAHFELAATLLANATGSSHEPNRSEKISKLAPGTTKS